VRKIGVGGMAEVYLAHDSQKNPIVVKKILRQLASNAEYVRMFQNEFNILSKLKHPQIVRVIEVQKDCALMEYLDGRDWRVLSGFETPLPVVIAIFLRALEVLSFVHEKKIVHRDISPQNWMLTNDGNVKLLDFGISKLESESSHTVTGVLKGKYGYMSPEQASGEKVSYQSDIFSMGIILYEFCTRRRLFKRSNDLLTLRSILDCRVDIPADVPTRLAEIIRRSLLKEPDKRYQRCQDFAQDLMAFGQFSGQIASHIEVLEFIAKLPKVHTRVLFEITQVRFSSESFWGLGTAALFFGLFGLGW
jgi:serine/threonine protein kinase